MRKTAVIFLAAGESKRFLETSKVPKSLFEIEGKAWLQICFEYFAKFPSVAVIGAHQDLIETKLPEYKNQFIFNEHYQTGPFSSIICGIKQFSAYDQVIIFPIDSALPSEELMTKLLTLNGDAMVATPTYGKKGGHPVVLRKPFMKKLLSVDLQSSKARLDHQIKSLSDKEKHKVETEDKTVTFNINTEQDFLDYLPYLAERLEVLK